MIAAAGKPGGLGPILSSALAMLARSAKSDADAIERGGRYLRACEHAEWVGVSGVARCTCAEKSNARTAQRGPAGSPAAAGGIMTQRLQEAGLVRDAAMSAGQMALVIASGATKTPLVPSALAFRSTKGHNPGCGKRNTKEHKLVVAVATVWA